MLDDVLPAIADIRRTAYTGENRCLPCTVVNLAISVVVCGLVALVSVALAIALFVLAIGAIYLRGYLVPGTPALTARYLPARAKQYLGPHTATTDGGITEADAASVVDNEQFLRDADVLTECDEIDDLCLTDQFKAEWHDAVDRIDTDDTAREVLSDLIGLESEKIGFRTDTAAFDAYEETVVTANGAEIARWESRGAMLADLATASTLDEQHSAWSNLDRDRAGGILLRLRVFLEMCPLCGGSVSLDETTYDGCCGPEYAVEATCTDCGELLIRPPEQRL